MPQTKSEIREILEDAGLRPNKRLGQNFLIDGNLMLKLVGASDIGPLDVVLEVGAGTGGLTELICERAGGVVAVEIDHGLFEQLDHRLGSRKNLTLVRADILASKSRVAPEVLSELEQAREGMYRKENAPRMMLVSNLPYHIASPLLVDLLLCPVPFDRFCFSVQREVADKIVGQPGSKAYGPLAITLQACSRMRKIVHIPPQAFWPQPGVDSTVLRLDIDKSRFPNNETLQKFITLVRTCFAYRRKTLQYNLRKAYEDTHFRSACAACGIDVKLRAEAISLDKWFELFHGLQSK